MATWDFRRISSAAARDSVTTSSALWSGLPENSSASQSVAPGMGGTMSHRMNARGENLAAPFRMLRGSRADELVSALAVPQRPTTMLHRDQFGLRSEPLWRGA